MKPPTSPLVQVQKEPPAFPLDLSLKEGGTGEQPWGNGNWFSPVRSTLDPDDVEACLYGLASVSGSQLDFGSLGEEEREIWYQAKENGYLTLRYEKARNRLALLVLWEMYCWSLLQPTLWWFPSEKTCPRIAVNIHTTGYSFGVKNWLALTAECRDMGLVRKGPIINGVLSFTYQTPLPTKTIPCDGWSRRIKNAITANLRGTFQDRMGYSIVWNSLGYLWFLRQDETSNAKTYPDFEEFQPDQP